MAFPSGHGLLLVSLLGVLTLGDLSGGQSSTLIFTKNNTVQNCSCSAEVRDCDYVLASILCSCAAPSSLEEGGQRPRDRHPLTVWFTDASRLGPLLNFTQVQDLKLCLCGTTSPPPAVLAVCGLRRLRVTAEVWRPSPEQSLLIREDQPTGGTRQPAQGLPRQQPCGDISFVDMALFNRDSTPLKSYSVTNVTSLTGDLPNLSLSEALPIPKHSSYIVTFIY